MRLVLVCPDSKANEDVVVVIVTLHLVFESKCVSVALYRAIAHNSVLGDKRRDLCLKLQCYAITIKFKTPTFLLLVLAASLPLNINRMILFTVNYIYMMIILALRCYEALYEQLTWEPC